MNFTKFALCFLFISLTVKANAEMSNADILRNTDDNSIKYMTYDEAITACPTGTHLPTVNEFTKHAQSLGAKILKEEKQLDFNPIDIRYSTWSLVAVTNPDKIEDPFYYSVSKANFDFRELAYQQPEGDIGSIDFWTSSKHYDIFGVAFNGLNGYIDQYRSFQDRLGVLCVNDQ